VNAQLRTTPVPSRVLALDHVGVLGGAELSMLDVMSGLGAEVSVRLFADGPFRQALERRGVDVRVLSMGALGDVKKLSRVPSPRALFATWRLAGRVADEGRTARVLYANSQKAFVVAAIAGFRCARPVVWHLRDLLGPPHFSAMNTRAVVTLANRGAARVIANSHATAAAFVAAGGVSAKVRVVHNGIDAAPFDAVTDTDARVLRAELSPTANFVMAMFGRLSPWKGQDVALAALRALPPDCHLWIVGAALFGEQAYEAELRAAAASLGVADRVCFLGFRDDVPALMKAADVVVHASTLPEPFGRVAVEGMLAVRPVVATAAGGIGEIITDGRTGVLVPPGDAPALARAVQALRSDSSRAAALAAAGAAHARAAFTVGVMVRGVRAVLDEVTG
jgi:glycosyltransferase involved in cell wall biosynthesis